MTERPNRSELQATLLPRDEIGFVRQPAGQTSFANTIGGIASASGMEGRA